MAKLIKLSLYMHIKSFILINKSLLLKNYTYTIIYIHIYHQSTVPSHPWLYIYTPNLSTEGTQPKIKLFNQLSAEESISKFLVKLRPKS
ncbi:hypothetical protein CDL12_13997 [Handroanthus impetiginosus]|uniref:Uncharacterized protein n=1 Tax=Handroanthus impetiginosus TaxID=429701 RepID=A0A2G9H784_9LAMI|nr:hypothetical protein CDL12_13997 [Handroanthus impetiginosus]